jgi:hypothetical protein
MHLFNFPQNGVRRVQNMSNHRLDRLLQYSANSSLLHFPWSNVRQWLEMWYCLFKSQRIKNGKLLGPKR